MAYRLQLSATADGLRYHASCSECTFVSVPFEEEFRARAAGQRHEWERHSVQAEAIGVVGAA